MKRKWIISIFSLLIASQLYAQKISEGEVPEAVKNAFNADFPQVKNVNNWFKRPWKPNVMYEVTFFNDKKLNSARYLADGDQVYVSIGHLARTLPEGIADKVLAENPGFRVTSALEIISEKYDSHVYRIRLSKKGAVLRVYVDTKGDLVEENKLAKIIIDAAKNN
ncbi:MAG: hypothetical protein AAFX87_18760 [Bacteroidota bacterium]